MANYEISADFYRELSLRCNKELEDLWREKEQRDVSQLKKANTITSVSFALLIGVLICSLSGLVSIIALAFPIIGVIYGMVSTPTKNNMDREYWDKRVVIISSYLNMWQKSEYYCNLPYSYIQDFREISVEYWADVSGLRFKASHQLYR